MSKTIDNQIHCAYILAAGFGTRLKPLTNKIPKCLTPVLDKPLLGYALSSISSAVQSGMFNTLDIYINTHYLAEQVSNYAYESFGAGQAVRAGDICIELLYESKILDTGGAIKNLCAKINRDDINILIHNADSFFYGQDFIQDFISQYDGQDFFIAVVSKHSLEFECRGDFDLAQDGSLVFKSGGEYVYTGLAIVNTKNFAQHPDDVFSVAEFFKSKMFHVKHFVLPQTSKWISIENVQHLHYINNALKFCEHKQCADFKEQKVEHE